MKKIWNKFTAWLSGWPEGTKENNKIKADEELFRKEEIIEKSVKESQARKAKKPKGLNPKKKKKSKGKKQGNLT
jgi:hypothetical protein|tara:strand:- start:31 stop:252 length:222 start_codon:yes stop_codon:yes gene_type:complete